MNTWYDIDLALLHFFNNSSTLCLDEIVLILTSGYTWIPLYLALIYMVVRTAKTKREISFVLLGAALCILLSDGMADGIVKPLVGRLRPINDPTVRYTLHFVDGIRASGYSFFSAHASNTMSIALYCSLVFRNRWVTALMFAWSILNCWTRLYLGAHYPSDILVGILWGLIAGSCAYYFYKHYTKL